MTSAQEAYRSAKVAGATQIQAHILVLDQICLHLGQAAFAVTKGDIVSRCQASNDAILLLGHLETWAPLFGDPLLAETSIAMYGYCRAQLLSAQGKSDPQPFLDLAALLAGLAEAWRKKEALLLGVQEGNLTVLASARASEPEGITRSWQV